MATLDQIATKIITEQELVIGPLAWSEAGKVQGLQVSDHHITFNDGDQKEVVNRLVSQYERLFGRASHEVCREAVASMIADLKPEEIPSSLR
ncbi:MAG: hypothetical protein PHV93_00670 [Candidatus Pacebacteria bacterium]|nr:hypothetical protein [Candidatus Paceibacterota bacterium]